MFVDVLLGGVRDAHKEQTPGGVVEPDINMAVVMFESVEPFEDARAPCEQGCCKDV